MSDFNKDASIMAQNAGSTAAVLFAAFTNANGYQGSLDDFLADYDLVRKSVYNGTIALSGADAIIEEFGSAPAPQQRGGGGRSFGGGNRRSGGGGGGNKVDPGSVDVKFGKYRGMTLADIHAEDPSYVEWLAESAENDFLRRVAGEFIAAA